MLLLLILNDNALNSPTDDFTDSAFAPFDDNSTAAKTLNYATTIPSDKMSLTTIAIIVVCFAVVLLVVIGVVIYWKACRKKGDETASTASDDVSV
jgi:uncharacterized iron-regulated membrane protein